MTKQDLKQVINDKVTDENHITFVEKLDSGENNLREMLCSKEEVINIIDIYFDDNLHGHVRDNIQTTIVSYLFK